MKEDDETDIPYRCIPEQDEVCIGKRKKMHHETAEAKYFVPAGNQSSLIKS